jgi:hypothetical protein
MSQFENVTIVKKANSYFNGNVTSRTILFGDGVKKTLGILMPGEYEFNTADKEHMEILGGELDVKLPGSENWKHINQGDSFEVPANSKFIMRTEMVTDYCCSFIKD